MFAFIDKYIFLILSGIISSTGGEIEPFNAVEQACLTETVKDKVKITRLSVGGFIIQTIIVYWFHLYYQLNTDKLGLIMMLANIVSGLSAILSTRHVGKFGTINAMVFTHHLLATPSAIAGIVLQITNSKNTHCFASSLYQDTIRWISSLKPMKFDNNIEAQSLVTTETTDTRRTYDGYIIATLTYPVLCTKEQNRIKPLTDHEIERRMQEAAIFVTNPNDIFDANTNEIPENICKSSGLSTNHVYLTTVLLPTIAHFCVHATITSWSDMINHFILYTIIIGNPSAGKLRFHCPLS
ncbi:unnamed protein product [Didymodactylos carnosus]|uniref:Uncharacterized protein n=1 Tax=Didymodactylos carnosus TaxID=1234261 RepID=A0A8S2DBM4_9BILA|nr:unnamed protein product [Didymodactylos carnosus]CAF3705285.1 unnamed protein product [Didymodactylos carnosus]